MLDDNGKFKHVTPDTIDKIMEQRKQSKKQDLIAEEEQQQYIDAINRIFTTPDGKYFLNVLKKACGVNSFDNEINPAKLIEDAARRKLWLQLIRPYLDVNILRELEQ